MRRILGVLGLAAALAAPGAAGAHHGINKMYDQGKTVTVVGTIDKVAWINPHIFFTVTGQDGKTYKIESVPIAFARRAGITKAALMGDGKPVTVSFTPARADPLQGFSSALKYSNGHVISFAGFKE